MTKIVAKAIFIQPGSLGGNPFIESFNDKLFASLSEAEGLLKQYKKRYNAFRMHSYSGI